MSVGWLRVRTMPRMCAVGSSQETSIAAATPVGIGPSLRGSGGAAPGARRVAGGASRTSMLGGGNAAGGGGSLLTGGDGGYRSGPRPQFTVER